MSQSSRTPAFLTGPNLYLRPLEERDVDGPYLGWLNDAVACAGNSHHVFPYDRRQALEYVKLAASTKRDLILAMVLRATNEHIGNVALSAIHPLYRSAQFSILIGDRAQWGKGYGLEAGRLLLGHGFKALNLERIECGTFSTNVSMCKLAAALGMRQEGVRRRAAWKAGEYVDIVEFGILRAEFSSEP
jgi:RimJ/RimL family protein N-acetyltransferase